MNGDNSYDLYIENAPNSDEYIVLQMTMKYNETSGLTAYLPFAFSNKVDDNNYIEIAFEDWDGNAILFEDISEEFTLSITEGI
jgi:hypothetical protein